MSWVSLGVAAIGAGGTIGASMIGNKKASLPSLPPFIKDPLAEKSENDIFNFGSDVLKGILPSSYQNLLQMDSPQFNSVLHNSNRDIEQSSLETAARTGNINSGAVQAGISRAVGDNSANMRYADYMNTMTNQKALLGLGLNAEQTGGSMALTNQGQQNEYQLGGYSAMLGAIPKMTQLSMAGQAGTGSLIGSAFNSAIGALPYLSSVMGQGSSVTANSGGGPLKITGALGTDSEAQMQELMKSLSGNKEDYLQGLLAKV